MTAITTRSSPSGPLAARTSAVLFWAQASNTNGITPAYCPPLAYDAGISASLSNELNYTIVAPRAGTLRNLFAQVFGVSAAVTATFKVRVNGVNSALTCTIASSGTLASNTANTVTIAQGDLIVLQTVLGSAIAGPTSVHISCEFA